MLGRILAVTGTIGSVMGAAIGMSPEHRKFLESGYCCPHCGARLLNALGNMTVSFYAADGRKLSLWAGGALRADTMECPKCLYRWKNYGEAPAAAVAADTEVLDIVETDRSEEFFGDDRRVIDNTQSAATPKRNFAFSKEWSRTFTLEIEKVETGGASLTLGAKDLAALQLSSEKKLQNTYSASEQTRETTSEDVSCEIPAHCKLTIIVRWKRIWQHGFVVAKMTGGTVKVPFRVAVAVTFDQTQIQEGGDAQGSAAAPS